MISNMLDPVLQRKRFEPTCLWLPQDLKPDPSSEHSIHYPGSSVRLTETEVLGYPGS